MLYVYNQLSTQATSPNQHRRTPIAGVCDVPVEITGGLWIDRYDLCSTNEEVDMLIAQQPADCPVHGPIVAYDMSLEFSGHLKIG